MLDQALLAEAQRELIICNACRYCEGVCAVFPAMEQRTEFSEADVRYLANLCHDCRACFYVCPFAPPHEFDVNFPKVMAQVRETTYRHYAFPSFLGRFVDRTPLATVLVGTLGVLAVLTVALATRGADSLVQAHQGPESFFQVVPWLAMVGPMLVLGLLAVAVMAVGLVRFWRETGPRSGPRPERATLDAGLDILALRNMRGGGVECHYPGERHSRRRWVFHTLVFYGFIAALISTAIAAVAEEGLGIQPPYPLLSLPVLFGIVGGVSLIIGSIGLIWLKLGSDRPLADPTMQTMDFGLLGVILGIAVTGMLLLTLRETPAMGVLLVVHLGLVVALFVTAPYGKLVHGVYRGAAILRDRLERE